MDAVKGSSPLYRAQADAFINELLQLDAADLARLKRNAGRGLDEARDVFRVFFSLLPTNLSPSSQADDYFMIATLFPFDRTYRELRPDNRPRENLGATLWRVREAQRIEHREDERSFNSLDRRFEALLDASCGDELRFRLGQVVRLIVARRLPIDWPQLLTNVLVWEGGRQRRRTIQLLWAKHYFAHQKVDRNDI